jgi:hypothetical protein
VELTGPTKAASRHMEKLASRTSRHHMGTWGDIKNAHQCTAWNLDASAMELYRHNEIIWTKHRAVDYGRLRIESTGVIMAEPRNTTKKADGTQRRRKIELSEIHPVQPHEPEGGNDP